MSLITRPSYTPKTSTQYLNKENPRLSGALKYICISYTYWLGIKILHRENPRLGRWARGYPTSVAVSLLRVFAVAFVESVRVTWTWEQRSWSGDNEQILQGFTVRGHGITTQSPRSQLLHSHYWSPVPWFQKAWSNTALSDKRAINWQRE